MDGPRARDPAPAGGRRAGRLAPDGEEGREIAALHRRWLTVCGNAYDPRRHKGLADLYTADARFLAYYDREVPGCARFLRDAVWAWVQ